MVHIRTLMDEMTQIDEGRMKDIFTANQEGESAKEIAKRLKLPLKTVKSILGEETSEEEISEFTTDMIKRLKKSYSTMPKTISPEQAKALSKHLDRLDLSSLKQLSKEKIPFITTLARNKIYKKTGKFEELEEARFEVMGKVDYKGISGSDDFSIVIDARNEKDAEDKVSDMLFKHRNQGKIGPRGGRGVDDYEIEDVSRTSKRATNKFSTYQAAEKNPVSEATPDPITYGPDKVNKAMKIAVKSDGNYSNAVREIEKIGKDLSKVSTIARALKKANESVNEANIDVDNVDKKDSSKEKELKLKLDKEKDTDAIEKQLIAAQGQINILKQKLENEKNRAIKPEPNPETGEVPLTVGIAHKLIKDKQDKEMKKEEVDNYPTSDINKKKHASYKDPKSGERKPVHTHEGAKLVYETIKGLKNKADKTGMPYSILKKVYDRGMAAWRGGHRPGTSQQQWAFARVNSFVTKSSGTWGGADKDLAKQVRGKN